MKSDAGQASMLGQFLGRPISRLGRWAAALMFIYLGMMVINSTVLMRLPDDLSWRQTVLPFYGVAMMLCGLVSGVLGVIAVTRKHERSWLVWLPVLFGVLALVFLAGEFLFPH